ncbi:MAG: hypothetical protein ABI199_00725 [Bacteroidia bacterium]
MIKKILFCCIFFSFSSALFAQFKFSGQIPTAKRYKASQVVDSAYGITMYDKLNPSIGGDSVRNEKGYAAQGQIIDYYEDGKIIHKGYYVDGQLKLYSNYFENGQIEREFKIVTIKKCHMTIFYNTGKIKSDITYYNGQVESEQDFYPNGNVSYIEESDKSLEHIIKRDSYLENGQPESTFELRDADKKKHKEYLYDKKEYFPNGKVSKSGSMKYVPAVNDYQKDGTWNLYDESGKLIEVDDYINGMLNDQKRQ